MLALLFLLASIATTAHAQPCSAVEQETLRASFDAWREVTRVVDRTTDLVEARHRWDALAANQCARELDAVEIDDLFGSWRALRRYLDAGGDLAIAFQLAHATDRAALLPTPPLVLRADVLSSSDPLRALLCAEDDDACLAESATVYARTSDWLAMHDELARLGEGARDAQCAGAAMIEPEARRFDALSACIASAHAFATILPDAPARLPTRGWIVLRGRRGHYAFCQEARAYDLATGAAYVAQHCDQLEGMPGATGPVDHDEAGRVPVGPLRELAWFLALTPHVETRSVGAFVAFDVPPGVAVPVDPSYGFAGLGPSGSSAQTTIGWQWSRGRTIVARGALTWPDSADATEAYADHLIRTLEAGWRPGCAPARLPRHLLDEAYALEARLAHMRAPRCHARISGIDVPG